MVTAVAELRFHEYEASISVFNPAQMQLLKMMSFVKSPEMLSQPKQVISDFFAQQAQKEIERLWETEELTDEKVKNFRQLHERTPYE